MSPTSDMTHLESDHPFSAPPNSPDAAYHHASRLSSDWVPVGSPVKHSSLRGSATPCDPAPSDHPITGLVAGSEADTCSCPSRSALEAQIAQLTRREADLQDKLNSQIDFTNKLKSVFDEERAKFASASHDWKEQVEELRSQLARSQASARWHNDRAIRLEADLSRTASAWKSDLLAGLSTEREAASLRARVDTLERFRNEAVLRDPTLDPEFGAVLKQRSQDLGFTDLISLPPKNIGTASTTNQAPKKHNRVPYPDDHDDIQSVWQHSIESLEICEDWMMPNMTPQSGRDYEGIGDHGYRGASRITKVSAPSASLGGVLDYQTTADYSQAQCA